MSKKVRSFREGREDREPKKLKRTTNRPGRGLLNENKHINKYKNFWYGDEDEE